MILLVYPSPEASPQLVEGRVQTIFLAKNFGMHFMKGLSICNHMGYSKKSPLGTTRFIKFQITFSVLVYITIVSVFYIRNWTFLPG